MTVSSVSSGKDEFRNTSGETGRRPSTTFVRCVLCTLISYVVLLSIPGFISTLLLGVTANTEGNLLTAVGVRQWLENVVVGGGLMFGRFFILGVLVALFVSSTRNQRSLLASTATGFFISLGMSVFIRWVNVGRFPDFVQMSLPSLGCLLGVWTLLMYRRGFWARVSLVGLYVAITTGAAGLVYAALEDSPLPFETPRVSSAQKRHLVNLVQNGPCWIEGGQKICGTRLEEGDVNLLLSWAGRVGSPHRKAKIRFENDRAKALISLELPWRRFANRYVNIQAEGRLRIINGRESLRLDQLRIGRLEIPRFLLRPLTSAVMSALRDEPRSAAVLGAIVSFEMDAGGVTIERIKGKLGKFIPFLLSGAQDRTAVLAATRAQLQHLTATFPLPFERPPTFEDYLRVAFTMAKERSATGDPIEENRAALFALSILLGHHRVEDILGDVTNRAMRKTAKRTVGRVALRGRRDWTRHFYVSAAITLLSSDAVSDEIGLLKEELDAAKGGSGFSFSDLMADRAGTLFAMAATRDEQSARQIQEQMSNRFEIDDLFPPAADLPERIGDAELLSQFGGVGGSGYEEIMADIERRLAACPALR